MTETNKAAKGFNGAQMVSTVMKAMAVLILLGGLVTALAVALDHSSGTSSRDRLALALGVALGCIPVAALWAWFGYVLDVLLESYWTA